MRNKVMDIPSNVKTRVDDGRVVLSDDGIRDVMQHNGVKSYRMVDERKYINDKLHDLSDSTIIGYIQARICGLVNPNDRERKVVTVANAENDDYQFLNSLETNRVLREVKRRMGGRFVGIDGKEVW